MPSDGDNDNVAVYSFTGEAQGLCQFVLKPRKIQGATAKPFSSHLARDHIAIRSNCHAYPRCTRTYANIRIRREPVSYTHLTLPTKA